MKFGKTSSVEELQLISRYEGLRKVLFSDGYAEHLEKPLAYWALPSDRRLPLAFLGRTLRDLLRTPFAELTETPGIGQKKIRSFIRLLERAAKTDVSELPLDCGRVRETAQIAASSDGAGPNGFDPSSVSEIVWSQWRASVIQHGLGDEALGRLAPSLRNMTRVIWNTPLRAYTESTLDEMRAKKTHGEKRVRAVLEVFHSAHAIVAGMGKQDHLLVRIVPRLIDQAEQWIGLALQTPGVPTAETLFENLIRPLLEQVRNDSSQQIAMLADARLGIGGPITSVRQAARSMGLTRARVYQLLNEINDIMMVRWPTGRHQVYELREKYDSEAAQMPEAPDLRQFHATVELFYPGSRRGAAGPLDRARVSDREMGELIEA